MTNLKKLEGNNFAAMHLGEFKNMDQHIYTLAGKSTKGKLFLKNLLKLTGSEISINKLTAGYSIPFYHQHTQHEEVYIFIRGKGQFQVDDETFDISEGTVIRVAPNGVRAWRNNSQEDLYYLCIQANEGSLTGDSTLDGKAVKKFVTWPELSF